MEIVQGTDRTVIVGKSYVAKFAKSSARPAINNVIKGYKLRGLEGAAFLWTHNSFSDPSLYSSKGALAHGLLANRREQRIARTTGLVVPTHSVGGGIVNIQPNCEPIPFDFNTVWSAFSDELGPRVTKLGHTLENTHNFGVYQGEVKFVDGGGAGLERLTVEYPEKIRKALAALTIELG